MIFIWTKYLFSISYDPVLGFGGDERSFTAAEIDAFFDKLKGINNRCGNIKPSPKFDKRLMSEFMRQNDGKGCVLIFLDEPNLLKQDTAEGIYWGPDHFDRLDVVIMKTIPLLRAPPPPPPPLTNVLLSGWRRVSHETWSRETSRNGQICD